LKPADERSEEHNPQVRAVVQRVNRAAVSVAGEVVGRMDRPGLAVLVGVTHTDTAAIADKLADKLWGLRVLDGERSCSDLGAPLLIVSQFTLYGDARKGRRPSWVAAAPGAVAEGLVEVVVAGLRSRGAVVATGVFGAQMEVELVNDGPFTVLLEL
jgi:D-tyrosyl-tRNA(Tyr) deacylase